MRSGELPADGALDAELTALRARAYGVDADIDVDPVAAARLAELEALHLAASAHPAPDAGGRAGSAPTRTPAPPAAPPVARPWWRRGRLGAFLAGVIAATIVALGIVGWTAWTAPRPAVTLHQTGAAPSEQVLRLTDYARRQLVMKSTLRAFDRVLGLEVFSADSVLGNSCLLVFEPFTDDLIGVACVPPPAQPMVEIYDVPVAWNEEWTKQFPTGTAVRFVLVGDTVDVWIYEGHAVRRPAGGSGGM
jgi:hypothetical protein